MSDLLSSASLLLTMIALLYGMWYQEIVKAIETVVQAQPQDRVPDRKRVKSVFRTKALPLAVASAVLTVVFVPVTIKILVVSVNHVCDHGWKAVRDYDAVATSLVLVTLGAGFFSWHLLSLAKKVREKLNRLGSN
jgi:hypothetical protein